jgi:hypothetical protein
MAFINSGASIVRSVLQRNLLNTWSRLYDRTNALPAFEEFRFDRLADERPDLVCYDVVFENSRPSFRFVHQGDRLAEVFGVKSQGQDLERSLLPHHVEIVMPAHYECLLRCRPVYSVFELPNVEGRTVIYERLLLPFGMGLRVTYLMASIKTISEDGAFPQSSLMRPGADVVHAIQAVIDGGLAASRIERQLNCDVVEI